MKCPYCGAQIGTDAPYCGECGKRWPPTPGVPDGRRWPVTMAVLASVAIACICGSVILAVLLRGNPPAVIDTSSTPTRTPSPPPSLTSAPQPTPEAHWLRYESQRLGVSVQYPQDWLIAEDADLGQMMFAPQQQNLQPVDFLRGTSLAVVVDASGELAVETSYEAVQHMATLMSDAYPDAELGEIQPYRIGGQDGALITLEGEFAPQGTPLKGWVAAVLAYDHIYSFAAAAPASEWTVQQSTLQSMLASVQLSQPQPSVAQPSPTSLATATPTTPVPTPLSQLPEPGPDPYEPDDSIANAAPIATDGSLQLRNLHTMGNHDYLSFEAVEGMAYTIETLNLGPEIDTIIYLYDDQDQEIARNDDGTEEPLASRIVWVAPSSGIYYVKIRDLAEDSAGLDASYTISIVESPFAEGADVYEPDDVFDQATLIDVDGTRQTHTFHTTTDVDYVAFAVEEGVEYEIATGSLQSNCDTVIHLYAGDGVELDYNDDASEESFASRIVWKAPSTGVHYVMARDFAGRAGPAVSYEIWISTR